MSDPTRPLPFPVRATVGTLKGGASRSTTALYLTLALARQTSDPVMLVDGDGVNGTSYEWTAAAGEEWPRNASTTYWASQSLAQRVQAANPSGHLIIDTAPNAPEVFRQALTVSDHLIMPIAPYPQELLRIQPTLALAAEVGMNRPDRPLTVSLLLTRTIAGTRSLRMATEEAEEAAEEYGFTFHSVTVPRLERIPMSYGTNPDDLTPYPSVLDEIIDTIKEARE